LKKIKIYIFWVLIIAGFIIRYLSLSHNGIFDIATYNEWGLSTLKNGLNASYQGTYFPFQYQLFEFGSWISTLIKVDYFIVFKSINLLFDCGNLLMLYLILNIFKVSKFYLLIYWLHPWFLNMFILGYCDFQFTFFILGSLFFTLKDSSKNFLIAGIFLGFAFLMKPQVQMIFLAFFIYSLIRYFKSRDLKIFQIFVFPVIIFIDYSLFFLINSGNPFKLVSSYLRVANVMPCLTANFLNGWFPIAYFLKGPDDPIYSISDKLAVSGFYMRHLAIALVFFLIYYFVKRLNEKRSTNETGFNLYLIACFSSFVVPFVMTSAHENHLFLATVLLIPLLGKSKNFIFKAGVHIILLLQFINLYGYYRLGDIKEIKFISFNYTYEVALILSLVASLTFIILLYYFLSKRSQLISQSVNQPGFD
jgi:hypothetical protein